MSQFLGEDIREGAAIAEDFLDRKNMFEVVIIGAGISGLQTAKHLITKHGVPARSILVVDAQNYIGGRIRQNHDFLKTGFIELGAEILHGEKTLLTEFGEEHNLEMYPIYCWAHGDGGPMEEDVNGMYGLYYYGKSKRFIRFDDSESEDFHKLNQLIWEAADFNELDFDVNLSLYDYLIAKGSSEEMIAMANAGYANTLCSNIKQLSFRQVIRWGKQWNTEGDVEGDFKYRKSFKVLIDYMKEGVQIALNTPISHVQMLPCASPSSPASSAMDSEDLQAYRCVLTVKDTQRKIYAKTCVVTSSVHVLQTPSLLSFDPPLPLTKQTALQAAILQRAMKVFLQFDECVWPWGLAGMIMTPESCSLENHETYHIPETWFTYFPCELHKDQTPSSTITNKAGKIPVLNCPCCSYHATGFICGDFAKKLDELPEDNMIIQTVLQQLDRVFSELQPKHWFTKPDQEQQQEEQVEVAIAVENAYKLSLPSNVFVKGFVERWTPERHPYIGGGYAAGLVGFSPDYQHELAAPVENTLFFAGEATNFPAGSTVHAAMESGLRAADQIAAVLLKKDNNVI
jgi:hypothetical protein